MTFYHFILYSHNKHNANATDAASDEVTDTRVTPSPQE